MDISYIHSKYKWEKGRCGGNGKTNLVLNGRVDGCLIQETLHLVKVTFISLLSQQLGFGHSPSSEYSRNYSVGGQHHCPLFHSFCTILSSHF